MWQISSTLWSKLFPLPLELSKFIIIIPVFHSISILLALTKNNFLTHSQPLWDSLAIHREQYNLALERIIMLQKQKSGQRIKNRIHKSTSQLELTISQFKRQTSILSSPIKTQEDVDVLATSTYQRILKNKNGNFRKSIESFDEYIQNKVNIDRMSLLPQAYLNDMDARDRRVLIPFESVIYRQFQEKTNQFNSQLFLEEVRDWLVDVIQVTTSVSFNHFKKEELNLKQVKNYTAKNILLNIKEMFQINEKLSLQNRVELMKFVNIQSRLIFDHIMYKYPQNSGSNATKRLKNRIPKIDNRENDEFDFLKNNGIHITYRHNGDYSQDIMKVINKLISFPTDTFDTRDQNKQSNFQVFTQIMEFIFQNAGTYPVGKVCENIVGIVNERSGLSCNNNIKNLINCTLKLGESLAFKESVLWERKDHSVKDSGSENYSICQKVPAGTRQFSDEDIQGCIFKSHDTAILRILTKWVDQLHSKLYNAEEAIYTRLFKFKDNNGKLVNLNLDLREQIYQEARQELKKAKDYIKYLRDQNVYLQTLFAGQVNIGKHSKLDTKLGTFAAKINQTGSQYIFKHLNKLIHCLLSVSKNSAANREDKVEKKLLESINLVTLKIGDLLRCKNSCTQHQFLRIIEILQQFHMKNPDILKVVRIKNRLQRKDNDILINIFWMNKVECELQLSIKGNVKKIEQKYGDFCHLIYQITRARLGPISEMSSIICQQDPLVRGYCKQKNYSPELKEQFLTHRKKKNLYSRIKQEIVLKRKLNIGKAAEFPFICRSCRRLEVLSNPQFFYRGQTDIQIDCNQCRFEDLQSEKPQQAYQHIISSSFVDKDQEYRTFLINHINHWDTDEFINMLAKGKASSQRSFETIPATGLLMTTNQKTPKLLLFSTVLEKSQGRFIFAHCDNNGKQKIISRLSIKQEKQKQIDSLKEQMKKLIIFQFKAVKEKIEDGMLKLQCFRSDCCQRSIVVGPVLPPEKILQISQTNYLKIQIQSQKSVLRMNLIKDAFRKLEEVVISLESKGKLSAKIVKSIQNIKAYKCEIIKTSVISYFSNLIQINLSDNPLITALEGVEHCRYLKSLNVRNCDLVTLDDLKFNIRLRYLNVSKNQRLCSIQGLVDHCHLVQLIINNTLVSDLSPLNSCPSLQILDIENCNEIDSLNDLNAAKLSFLNTYGCLKLPQDPNLLLKKSILSKSHHLHMKRFTSQIQMMSDSIMIGGKNPMARSFQFDPLKVGLQCIAINFMTLMHDYQHPLADSGGISPNSLQVPLYGLFS